MHPPSSPSSSRDRNDRTASITRGGILGVDAQDTDPAMGPRWMGPDVAESTVQCDQEPAVGRRRRENVGIGCAGQVLAADVVSVVAQLHGDRQRASRQVLVELDPHREVGSSGYNSSRASTAA